MSIRIETLARQTESEYKYSKNQTIGVKESGVDIGADNQGGNTPGTSIIDDETSSTDTTYSSSKIEELISDIPSGELVVYSTEERLIGKWIDGKDLYEQDIVITGPFTGTKMVHLPNLYTYYDHLFIQESYIDCTAVSGQRRYSVPGNYSEPNYTIYTNLRYDFGDNYAQINIAMASYWTAKNAYVKIRYTKA